MKFLNAIGRMLLDVWFFIGKAILWLTMFFAITALNYFAFDKDAMWAKVIVFPFFFVFGAFGILVFVLAVQDWFRKHYHD